MFNTDIPYWLMAWGFAGQAMFTMRFVVQWFATEKAKKSVIPITFWYFSLCGSFMLLSYAIMRADPPIILGQAFGFIVYIRNLYFIKTNRKKSVVVKKVQNKQESLFIKTKILHSGDYHGGYSNSRRYILQPDRVRKTKSSRTH